MKYTCTVRDDLLLAYLDGCYAPHEDKNRVTLWDYCLTYRGKYIRIYQHTITKRYYGAFNLVGAVGNNIGRLQEKLMSLIDLHFIYNGGKYGETREIT